tara:strand:+ start:250 stop:351 length:102 start_codon:yes stop_codon:yes gene_type:complete
MFTGRAIAPWWRGNGRFSTEMYRADVTNAQKFN